MNIEKSDPSDEESKSLRRDVVKSITSLRKVGLGPSVFQLGHVW